MARRGRPRKHPEGMSPAELKREWDRRMRNDDGLNPDAPRRKPCVIYLSDEARSVIKNHRKIAVAAGTSPELTSKLIEDLLAAHGANPVPQLRPRRSQLELLKLLYALETRERAERLRDRVLHEASTANASVRPNARTIWKLVAKRLQERPASLEDLSALLTKITNHEPAAQLRLLSTLRALFRESLSDEELLPRFRRLIHEYIEELLSAAQERRITHSAAPWGRSDVR